MRFEMTIPPVVPGISTIVLRLEAANWMAALRLGLSQIGDEAARNGRLVCEVKEDGSVLARISSTGTTYHIKSVSEMAYGGLVDYMPEDRDEGRSGKTMLMERAAVSSAPTPSAARVEEVGVRPKHQLGVSESSGHHPCMVFKRSDIEARLRLLGVQQDVKAEAQPAGDAPRTEQPVRFIPVVDVQRRSRDQAESIEADLDGLRVAAAERGGRLPDSFRAPSGFEWVEDLLNGVMANSEGFADTANRLLRIALAAVPSRCAALVLKGPGDRLCLGSSVGIEPQLRSRDALPGRGGLLESLVRYNLSMALDSGSQTPHSIANLQDDLGVSARSAVLAALTSGNATVGVLVLLDSALGPAYTSQDLAVTTYIATRIHGIIRHMLPD